jgi:hypothetical protein
MHPLFPAAGGDFFVRTMGRQTSLALHHHQAKNPDDFVFGLVNSPSQFWHKACYHSVINPMARQL